VATTFDVIFLGVLADMDTVEGDLDAENAGALVGLTLGSNGDPLYDHIQSFSPGTAGYASGSATAYDPDTTNDTFSIDGGPDQTFDMAMLYKDDAGNTYLVPQTSNNSDQAALEAAPIESITLGATVPGANNGYGLTGDRYDGDFVEVVDGTSGNDNISSGYIDADGDEIDGVDGNNDYILAGDGNDNIFMLGQETTWPMSALALNSLIWGLATTR